MGFCDSNAVHVSKMTRKLKSGPMQWYKKRCFGSNWRDVYSVMFNDSSFFWFKDKSRKELEGGIFLKDSPDLIAYGPYTSQVPKRPQLSKHNEHQQLLAFGDRDKKVVYWFLCPNQEELTSWMNAIATTILSQMPPPPGAMLSEQESNPTESYSNGYPTTEMPQPQLPQQTMPHPMSSEAMTDLPHDPQQQPPQDAPTQQQVPSRVPTPPPGMSSNNRSPPHPGYNQVQPQPYPAYNTWGTTVVVQDRNLGYTEGGGGDFACMVLGCTVGTAWGFGPLTGAGFGCGGGSNNGSGFGHLTTNVSDIGVGGGGDTGGDDCGGGECDADCGDMSVAAFCI